MDERLLLTIPEAAEALGIGRSTAYELIADGRLETVHIGRACRVPVDGLRHFVESLRATASGVSMETPHRSAGGPTATPSHGSTHRGLR